MFNKIVNGFVFCYKEKKKVLHFVLTKNMSVSGFRLYGISYFGAGVRLSKKTELLNKSDVVVERLRLMKEPF